MAYNFMMKNMNNELKCDWKNCKNPAFMEVDYDDKVGVWHWSNLCLPHFIIETLRGKRFGYLLSQVWYSHFWDSVWKVWVQLNHNYSLTSIDDGLSITTFISDDD